MSKKKRSHRNASDERRVRKVDSELKTPLDKYKHILYNDYLYDEDDFYYDTNTNHTSQIHRNKTQYNAYTEK